MSDRDCYGSFSNTAGTDNADKAPYLKLVCQCSNSVIAADHPRWSWWQLLNSFFGSGPGDQNRLLDGRACDRRNKTITPTRNSGYVASTISSVAKRFSQDTNLKAQITFLYCQTRPHA